MRRTAGVLAAVIALAGSTAWGRARKDVKPGDLLALENLDDEETLTFYTDYYVSWHGLGRYKGRALDRKLVPAFEHLEKLIVVSNVDFVPVLIQSLRDVGYGRVDGTKPGPYFNMNLRGDLRVGREWPRRILDLLAEHARSEHALDFAYLLDCQDLGIATWAGEQILRLGGRAAGTEVARLLRERLSLRGNRFAKLGALAVYLSFDTDATSVIGALRDTDWMVRAHAVRALAAAGVERAKRNIRTMLTDPDIDVRQEARRALLRLDGKDPDGPWRPTRGEAGRKRSHGPRRQAMPGMVAATSAGSSAPRSRTARIVRTCRRWCRRCAA